jgi:hypothetical protein
MGIAFGGRIARMPENFTGEIETHTGSDCHGGIRMAQVADTRIANSGAMADSLPDLLHIDEVRPAPLSDNDKRVALHSRQRIENFDRGRMNLFPAWDPHIFPWQNGCAERLIGSIRRDCLDHVVVFGEQHLRHLLNSYQKYYNEARTHLSLHKDAPIHRAVQSVGHTLAVPILGGAAPPISTSVSFRQGHPPHYVVDPTHGAVRLSVGELRKLGFQVGWDPDNAHPHHGAVWGIGNGSKRKKKVMAIANTIKKAVGED